MATVNPPEDSQPRSTARWLAVVAGPSPLAGFADASRKLLREGDVLGRWGGEEFLLILPGASPGQTLSALHRLQSTVRDSLLTDRAVTFSAGVAAHRSTETAETLLERADAALYAAKHGGRDRVCIAPDM